MPVRSPLVAAALLLVGALLGGCSEDEPPAAAPSCDVGVADVVGVRPSYVGPGQTLDADPASDALCRGVWLTRAQRWFVPQGIALGPGARTAWVSGYRWRPGYGNRPCQLVHVDLGTGEQLAFVPRVEGRVGAGPEVFCRHGGGLARTSAGLWLAETERLWLLDEQGRVQRAWRLERPVSGGFLMHQRDRLGLGDYSSRGSSTAEWYRVADLLTPGMTTVRAGDAVGTTVTPRYAQGGAVPPGEAAPYLTASWSTCGVLVMPSGARRAFAPGAEGIAFAGPHQLWAVLESGTRPYQREGRPLTPQLARFDVRSLTTLARDGCDWQ